MFMNSCTYGNEFKLFYGCMLLLVMYWCNITHLITVNAEDTVSWATFG